MKLIANENFPFPSIKVLRENNFDIVSVIENFPGITDTEVLEYARKEKRIILTFDKDYGNLIFKIQKPTPLGIVLFRLTPKNPLEPANILMTQIFNQNIKLINKFTVITRTHIRQRNLKEY